MYNRRFPYLNAHSAAHTITREPAGATLNYFPSSFAMMRVAVTNFICRVTRRLAKFRRGAELVWPNKSCTSRTSSPDRNSEHAKT